MRFYTRLTAPYTSNYNKIKRKTCLSNSRDTWQIGKLLCYFFYVKKTWDLFSVSYDTFVFFLASRCFHLFIFSDRHYNLLIFSMRLFHNKEVIQYTVTN